VITFSPYWYIRGVTPHCRIRFPGGGGRPTTPRNWPLKTLCYFAAAGRGDRLRTDAMCSCIRLVPGLATTSLVTGVRPRPDPVWETDLFPVLPCARGSWFSIPSGVDHDTQKDEESAHAHATLGAVACRQSQRRRHRRPQRTPLGLCSVRPRPSACPEVRQLYRRPRRHR